VATRRRVTLAKLTRPRLFDAMPRQRLFRLLDAARKRPITWVAAPPGAGKTTLVASYLESRKAPLFWYQLDASDADPATFFWYLVEAD
jgi:LuxR family maltose regulon positive regulatory protein